MKPKSLIAMLGLAAVLAAFSVPSVAATFCVTSSAELRDALTVAAGNGQDDYINLTAGAYMADKGEFLYVEEASDAGRLLKIVGGWTGNVERPCDKNLFDPNFTMIDGMNRHRGMNLIVGPESSVEVWFLSFLQGRPEDSFCGGGLSIATNSESALTPDHAARIDIFLSYFLNNHALSGGGLCAYDAYDIHVINSVFAGNSSRLWGGAMMLFNGWPVDGDYWATIHATSNTVINNISELGYSSGIAVPVGDVVVLANNIVRNNLGPDIHMGTEVATQAAIDKIQVNLLHNAYETYKSSQAYVVTSEGNTTEKAEFVPPMFNYTLVADSPLIGAGYEPDGTFGVVLAPQDFYGNGRIAAGQIDIGAVEVKPKR